MFAVIKTGGKQYSVAEDQTIQLGKLAGKPGDIITFPVMLLGGDKPSFGTPLVSGALVAAEVVKHTRGATIIAFKKRRRQNSRRRRGHRQDFTVVRITEILTDGKQPSKEGEAPAGQGQSPESRRRGEARRRKEGRKAENKSDEGAQGKNKKEVMILSSK